MKRRSTDNVPAMLTPREAILNRNAAELLGRDAIKRLNDHGNMLAKRGVDLASDPTPGPSTENLLGYQYGTSMVQGDDRSDLLAESDNTFYGGGTAMPTPTPTPKPTGYQYGTDDVLRRRMNAASRIQGINFSQNALRGIPSQSGRDISANFPQGQVIRNTSFSQGSAVAPPGENPAYQAATAKGRPSRSGYTMIQTPSGGSMSVPIGKVRQYTDMLFKGNPTADTGFQRPNPQEAYALGNTGAIPTGDTPYARSFRMGSNIEGPVAPAPSAGIGYQVGSALKNTAPYALSLATNAASRLAQSVSNFFGGGNTPNVVPSANAGQPMPTPTPVQTPPPVAPSPTPTPTIPPEEPIGYQQGTSIVMPRRYSDYY